MRTRLLPFALLLLTLAVGACDKQGAYGDATSILTVAAPTLWDDVQDSVYTALEPTIWTVRNEKTFTVTYVDPADENWGSLRQFRQMLLIGPASAPYIAEALDRSKEDDIQAPTIVQVHDVWARDQQVTILLTPENLDEPQAVYTQLPELRKLYDRQYRQLALARMYVSGVDSALADTLGRDAGFEVLLPNVYYWDQQDSVYIFRNDNPDPSELIREVAVTWMSPSPESLEAEDILAWRNDIVDAYYAYPQVVDLSNAQAGPMEFQGHEGYQIQAVWQNPPDSPWPAAGPFILRVIKCPEQDRMYYLDAWLYAPGKEKYQYMIQLETILDTFRCAPTT